MGNGNVGGEREEPQSHACSVGFAECFIQSTPEPEPHLLQAPCPSRRVTGGYGAAGSTAIDIFCFLREK